MNSLSENYYKKEVLKYLSNTDEEIPKVFDKTRGIFIVLS